MEWRGIIYKPLQAPLPLNERCLETVVAFLISLLAGLLFLSKETAEQNKEIIPFRHQQFGQHNWKQTTHGTFAIKVCLQIEERNAGQMLPSVVDGAECGSQASE